MPAQTEIAGIERTALGNAADDFIEQKDRIDHEKQKLEKIAANIVDLMRKENRRQFKIVHDGIAYNFEVTYKAEKLKCVKKSIRE